MKQALSVVWVGPELETHAAPPLPRKARRKYERQQAKRLKSAEQVVITEAMIPFGSLLSDTTLAAIRAGHLAVLVPKERG